MENNPRIADPGMVQWPADFAANFRGQIYRPTGLTPSARVRLSDKGRARNPELAGRTGVIECDLGDGCYSVEWDGGDLVSWIDGGMLEPC